MEITDFSDVQQVEDWKPESIVSTITGFILMLATIILATLIAIIIS